jgi:hypothetical protein
MAHAAGELRGVRALAVDLADRVHGRQVDHVEAHVGDRRQPLGGGGERAVGGPVADHRALGAGEELVPGAVERPRPVDPHLVARAAGDQLAHRVVVQHLLQRGREGRRDPGGELLRPVAQRGGGGADGVAVLLRALLGHPVEQPRALLEVVGEVLGALAGGDLHLDGVVPGGQRVAPRLDAEAPPPLAVGGDDGEPPVGLLAVALHADERHVARAAVRRGPGHVGGDGVVALAEHGGGDRQLLADHGARGERPAGHDGGDIGDAEAEVRAASHRRSR